VRRLARALRAVEAEVLELRTALARRNRHRVEIDTPNRAVIPIA
jgi:hypothetical protein